jgi:predicted  nucleic acid-binding Zn-ribbon protein
MVNIDELLKYQEKEKKLIALRLTVDGGRVRRELDVAQRALTTGTQQLLSLETDAKNLQATANALEKSLRDATEQAKKFLAQKPDTESATEEAAASVSRLIETVRTIEGQLENIARTIQVKSRAFDECRNAYQKAQQARDALKPQYEAELGAIKPEIDGIEKELNQIAIKIDKNLLEKYRSRRKNEPFGKVSDIVVPITNGRCGACNFEVPPLLIHKISTDQYIVCEECGKILYKR